MARRKSVNYLAVILGNSSKKEITSKFMLKFPIKKTMPKNSFSMQFSINNKFTKKQQLSNYSLHNQNSLCRYTIMIMEVVSKIQKFLSLKSSPDINKIALANVKVDVNLIYLLDIIMIGNFNTILLTKMKLQLIVNHKKKHHQVMSLRDLSVGSMSQRRCI